MFSTLADLGYHQESVCRIKTPMVLEPKILNSKGANQACSTYLQHITVFLHISRLISPELMYFDYSDWLGIYQEWVWPQKSQKRQKWQKGMAPQKIYPPGVPNQEFAPLEVKNEKTGTVGKSRSLSGQVLWRRKCNHSFLEDHVSVHSNFWRVTCQCH